MKRAFVACVMLLPVSLGCQSEADKETYQGKTGTEWIKISQDRDPKTRSTAVAALANMKSAQAISALKALFSDADEEVRHTALKSLDAVGRTESDDDLLDCLLRLTKATSFRYRGPQLGTDISVAPEFSRAVRKLGSKAKPLADELTRLKDEIAQLGHKHEHGDYVTSWLDDMLVAVTK